MSHKDSIELLCHVFHLLVLWPINYPFLFRRNIFLNILSTWHQKKKPSFPVTPGSKRIAYVRNFGRSTKANAPAKCRKAREAAKQEAIEEHKRRQTMSDIEQQREMAAAELEQKARAKIFKKVMASFPKAKKRSK